MGYFPNTNSIPPVAPHSNAGPAYLGYRPSKKSIKRMVETIHALTVRTGSWQDTTELVDRLNRRLRGRANYFNVDTVTKAYRHTVSWAASFA